MEDIYTINKIFNSLLFKIDFDGKTDRSKYFNISFEEIMKHDATIELYQLLQYEIDKIKINKQIELLFNMIIHNGYSLFNLYNCSIQNLYKLLIYYYNNHMEMINIQSPYLKYIKNLDIHNFVINMGLFSHQFVKLAYKLNKFYPKDYQFGDMITTINRDNPQLLNDILKTVFSSVFKQKINPIVTEKDIWNYKFIRRCTGLHMFNLNGHVMFIIKEKTKYVLFEDSFNNDMIHGRCYLKDDILKNKIARSIISKYKSDKLEGLYGLNELEKIVSKQDYIKLIRIFRPVGYYPTYKFYSALSLDRWFINQNGEIKKFNINSQIPKNFVRLITPINESNKILPIIDDKKFKTIRVAPINANDEVLKMFSNIRCKRDEPNCYSVKYF